MRYPKKLEDIVRYPKKLEGSLFLQKFLLGIGDETKPPWKVLQLISKAKKAVT